VGAQNDSSPQAPAQTNEPTNQLAPAIS
jgi:hypothetical protein